MNKDQSSNSLARRSWASRINQALTRVPSDTEQLLDMLRAAQQNNLFDTDALAMFEGVLQVDDMQVRDIMIPRSQVVMLARDTRPDVLLRSIVESGHSRFPVIGDSRDEVVGILLAKDFLLYAFERSDNLLNVSNILRPAIFVPESKRLNVLLKEFRSSRNHMAIVVDEYGGVAGMVTIEDVLEEIVGEIDDEHDEEEEAPIKALGGNSYRIDALAEIEGFNEVFDCDLSDEDYDTVGGLLLAEFGRVPDMGEEVVLADRFHFRVTGADNRRIIMLEMNDLNPD